MDNTKSFSESTFRVATSSLLHSQLLRWSQGFTSLLRWSEGFISLLRWSALLRLVGLKGFHSLLRLVGLKASTHCYVGLQGFHALLV